MKVIQRFLVLCAESEALRARVSESISVIKAQIYEWVSFVFEPLSAGFTFESNVVSGFILQLFNRLICPSG